MANQLLSSPKRNSRDFVIGISKNTNSFTCSSTKNGPKLGTFYSFLLNFCMSHTLLGKFSLFSFLWISHTSFTIKFLFECHIVVLSRYPVLVHLILNGTCQLTWNSLNECMVWVMAQIHCKGTYIVTNAEPKMWLELLSKQEKLHHLGP